MSIDAVLAAQLDEVRSNPKPIVLDTPLRYSSAGGCDRALGYQAMRAEYSDPMDLAGVVSTGVGTLRHEQIQALWQALCPGTRTEVASRAGVWSGSADIVDDDLDGQPVDVTELKSVGTYRRDKLWGIKGYRRQPAENAPANNVAQLALQVHGLGAERGNLVYLPNEPFSKGVADALKLSEIERVAKVFTFNADELEPIAQREMDRGEWIVGLVHNEFLPPRFFPETGKPLNPKTTKWPCSYCPWRTRCLEDGP